MSPEGPAIGRLGAVRTMGLSRVRELSGSADVTLSDYFYAVTIRTYTTNFIYFCVLILES